MGSSLVLIDMTIFIPQISPHEHPHPTPLLVPLLAQQHLDLLETPTFRLGHPKDREQGAHKSTAAEEEEAVVGSHHVGHHWEVLDHQEAHRMHHNHAVSGGHTGDLQSMGENYNVHPPPNRRPYPQRKDLGDNHKGHCHDPAVADENREAEAQQRDPGHGIHIHQQLHFAEDVQPESG